LKTLLFALTHQDDEVGYAGAIARHTHAGDRVVLLWLTRGEMTEVFGTLPLDEVARRRTESGLEAARILGCEPRFMDFPDTRVQATPEAAAEVARVIADVKPDAVITWGEAWGRGMRHPDHQATGRIVRDAVTLARISRVVAPLPPHRAAAPVFTMRGEFSTLPCAAIDVEPVLEVVLEVGRFYRGLVGWPPGDAWLIDRLTAAGAVAGCRLAELYDAWETPPGLFDRLV